MKSLPVLMFALLTLALPGIAKAPRKSDPGPHPIKILKVMQDSSSRETMNGTEGRWHIWMQNTTDVDVDKVALEVDFYNPSGRLVETVKKDIGTLESGHKNMAEVKYDIIGEHHLKPRIWVLYNGGGEKPTQFEVQGATWNW